MPCGHVSSHLRTRQLEKCRMSFTIKNTQCAARAREFRREPESSEPIPLNQDDGSIRLNIVLLCHLWLSEPVDFGNLQIIRGITKSLKVAQCLILNWINCREKQKNSEWFLHVPNDFLNSCSRCGGLEIAGVQNVVLHRSDIAQEH